MTYEKITFAVYEYQDITLPERCCLMSGTASTKTAAIWAIHRFLNKIDYRESDKKLVITFDEV